MLSSESTLPPANDSDAPSHFGTTLKVRLSLLITALLAVVALAGGTYVVYKARDDIHDETESTLNLTGHFLDNEIGLLSARWSRTGYSVPSFKLRELKDVRHLSVRFYDAQGNLLETNEDFASQRPAAPAWFAVLVRAASPPPHSEVRVISFLGTPIGRLVIASDPSYETDEMWSTSRGLLGLLLAFFVLVNGLVWWAASRAMRPVERILEALGELRGGNLSARLPSFGLPELSRISTGFNHMAETLELSVTENHRLTRRLLKTQETERTSLARELHDEIGQCVSAIHADAAAIRNRGGESVRESAEAIVDVTEHIKQIVRSMLQRLRPPILEGLGLAPALRELVAGFRQRNPQLSCTLRSSGGLASLDEETAVALYRVIQECLTNIAVHANARNATIEVKHAPAGIDVTVVDDGVGFFLMTANRGFGLTGIRERVKVLGGQCHIDTLPGSGTRVSVAVPLPVQSDGMK